MTVHRRYSPLTGTRSAWPLENARTAFDLLSAGTHPVIFDFDLPGFPYRPMRLDELRELLLDRRCPQATRDLAWAELLTRARDEGGVWRTACVGMALPGLTSTTARLTALYRADPAEVAAEVLYGFFAAMPTVDIARFGISARLQWAAFKAGFETLRRAAEAPMPIRDGFDSHPPAAPWGHPDFVLARAVAAGVITSGEADLIGATRLENVPLGDYGAERRTRVETVLKQRQRAERRLVAWLADDQPGAVPDDTVSAQYAGTHDTDDHRSPSKRSQSVVDLRQARRKRSRPRVSETARQTGVLQCGERPLSTADTTPPETTTEARRCA